MHKFTGSLAILALIGASAAAAPAMAAPTTPMKGQSNIDCSLNQNMDTDYCKALLGQNNNGNGNGSKPSNGPNNANNAPKGGPGGNATSSNGPTPGSWNWSPQNRTQFHQRFRGFNFGTFGTPNFSLSIGIGVPGSYFHYLRPVPSSIYRAYPWFRGYLYFVGRGGEFVIVSPRSHKIVAVI